MDIIRFADKSDLIWLCHKEMMQKQFLSESLSVWDKLEGTLPHLKVFVKSFIDARWASWLEVQRWN